MGGDQLHLQDFLEQRQRGGTLSFQGGAVDMVEDSHQ